VTAVAGRKKYPLESLVRHRDDRVQSGSRALGERTREAQAATERRETAERERSRHEEAVQRTEGDEARRLDRGDARASDLQQMTAWGVAQERIAQALDEHLGAAADTEEQARVEQSRARTALAEARAAADVIHRHREAFVRSADKAEQDAAEEESADVHAGRRSGSKR